MAEGERLPLGPRAPGVVKREGLPRRRSVPAHRSPEAAAMGIYDRDYYRREGPSFLGSILSQGTVCKWLIGVNVACFLVQMMTREEGWFTGALILDAGKVMQGQVWRLLTATFLHSTTDPLHILFNMLFLWWFGRQVEDELRSREFLTFYLAAAVLSSAAYVAAAKVGFQLGS